MNANSIVHSLHCHPQNSPGDVASVKVNAMRLSGEMHVQYVVRGDIDRLRWPEPRPTVRHDELWRHTCAELFVAETDKPGYCEFNFSPSSEWAAYAFDDYRRGMRALQTLQSPFITSRRDQTEFTINVQCLLPKAWADGETLQVALTMVIEAIDGSRSYWALAHAAPQPDFHRRESFVLAL